MRETGWVYVFTSEAMPGYVKVGVTSKRPEERAKAIDGTGSPTPYKVETAFLFSEAAERIEKRAHALLADVRVRKEWFRCSPKLAAEKVLDAAGDIGSEILKIDPILVTPEEIAEQKRWDAKLKTWEALRIVAKKEQERVKREQEMAHQYQVATERVRDLYEKARAGDFLSLILIGYCKSERFFLIHHSYGPWEENGISHLEFIEIIDQPARSVFKQFYSKCKKDESYWRQYLGLCYILGYGVTANPKKGFNWLKKAASWYTGGADIETANALAACYHHGIGVAKNPKKAAKWLKKGEQWKDKYL
ncbi:GIY-YIG nuclease family protein [bacterium]|nr:GIY-YIG nuclease family protein [bacterium]